jgi:hypothetical protein
MLLMSHLFILRGFTAIMVLGEEAETVKLLVV